MDSSDDDGARMSVVARGDHLGGDAACRAPRDSGKFIPTLMVAKRLKADVRNRVQIASVSCVQHITYSLFYVDAVIDDLSIRPAEL